MILDKKNNTKKGITFGLIYNVLGLLWPFLIQTAIVKKMGAEYAGIRGLFSSIMTILNCTELGIGSAMVYSMYKPIVDDDENTICALLNLYKKVYKYIGLVILMLGLAITPFVQCLIKGNVPEDININLVFFLYLLEVIFSYWLFMYKSSLLYAYQRLDVINKIGMIIISASSAFQLIAIVTFNNYYIYVVVCIVFTILNNFTISAVVGRVFPGIKGNGKVKKSLLKDIRVKIKGMAIGKICGVTRNTFDSIFISKYIGLAMTGIYANYFFIIMALNKFSNIVLESLVAGVGNSILVDSVEKNYKDMIKINFAYMIISGWSAIFMLCLYQPFMCIWVGSEYLLPNNTMILFPIYYFVQKMGDIRGVYSDGAGLFWENRHRSVFEAISNIILNYFFVKCWGVKGIIFATIIPLFIFGFLGSTIVVFKHYFKNGIINYLFVQLKCLLQTFVIGTLVYWVCLKINNGSLVRNLLLDTIICLLVPPVLFWICNCSSNTYKETKSWFIGLIK